MGASLISPNELFAMRLGLHHFWRQRALLAAHSKWRSECDAVRASYRRWVDARSEEEQSAFTDYRSALDREEHAAKRYARVTRRVGRLRETDAALQLGRIQTGDGAW